MKHKERKKQKGLPFPTTTNYQKKRHPISSWTWPCNIQRSNTTEENSGNNM